MKFETLLKQYMERPIKESYDDIFSKKAKYDDTSIEDMIKSIKVLRESKDTELVDFLAEQYDVIEELWGGLKNIGRGLGAAAKKVGGAVGNVAGNVAQNVGANVKAGVQNVKDTYQAGQEASAQKAKAKDLEKQMVSAKEYLGKIMNLYGQAITAGYIAQPKMPNWNKLISVGQISKDFTNALLAQRQKAQNTQTQAQGVANQGFAF